MNYYIGLDGGSTYLKAALIGDRQVIDTMVRSTGINNDETARQISHELCRRNGIDFSDVKISSKLLLKIFPSLITAALSKQHGTTSPFTKIAM